MRAITGLCVWCLNSVLLASSRPELAPGELDRRALHAQADPEEREDLGPGVTDGLDLPLDPPHPEPARDEQAVDARQGTPRPVSTSDVLGLDPTDDHAGPVGDPGVVERLVDRLVRVAMLHVFADDGDRHLGVGVDHPVDHLPPVGDVERPALDPESA